MYLYNILYNDIVSEMKGVKYDDNDFVIMKTPYNEEYKCYLPQDHNDDKDDETENVGDPAEVLLDPLFKVGTNNKPQCSFKLEVVLHNII